MLKYKIINYFGSYGTANFWSNIKQCEIKPDFKLIKESGFNTVLLLLPYAAFKPTLNSFTHKYNETLEHIMIIASELELNIVFRIGYLWESNFDEYRTFERYIEMYSSYKKNIKSRFEDDFLEYINYYYNNYNILHMILSWEDFFWPIYFYNQNKRDEDSFNEKETVKFLEYLLSRLGTKENLYIEQRTNGDFYKIRYNESISYSYYNTLNIQSWDDDFIGANFGRGIIIDESMLIEKQFIEWYSRLKNELNLDNSHKLIIDQFNIIDNTFIDDSYHSEFLETKQKLICSTDKLNQFFAFIAPIMQQNILGIGFWSLWTTYAGHVYNGTFKFGAEGWNTDGTVTDNVLLQQNQSLSTNFGYIRIDDTKTWNILLKYSAKIETKILLKFNNTNEILILPKGDSLIVNRTFRFIKNKLFTILCIKGNLKIERIECFNIKHESFLFDENREERIEIDGLKMLLN